MEQDDLLNSLLKRSYVTAAIPVALPPRRPWKSLNPYEEEDAELFCGRASDREDLLSHILSFDVTVLYGASGVGKTSLLNAAIVPTLQRMGLRVAHCQVTPDPVMTLRAAVYRAWPQVRPGAEENGQRPTLWQPLIEQSSLKPGVRARLRELLTQRMSPTDLQALCADLQEQIPDLNFHNFAGGLAEKVVGLSGFLDERQQWHLLIQELWNSRADLRADLEEIWQGSTHYRRSYPPLDTIEPGAARLPTLTIICDEFEKLFLDSAVPDVARRELVAEVVGAINRDDLPIKWVFCLRKEALGDFFAYAEPQSKRLVANLYRLDPLTREQAAEAICVPAERGELTIEPGLVERLLNDLATNDRIEPTQLQIVCDALFERAAQRNKHLTLRDYQAAGGTKGILKNYLNRVLEQRFRQEDIPTVKDLLVQLAGAQETTVALSAQTLAERLDLTRPQVEGYLRSLLEACLIRPALVDGGVMYELTHAYLLKEINSWLGREALALKRLQELVAQSTKIWDLEVPLPLTQEALDVIFPHRMSLRLSHQERLLIWHSAVLYGQHLPDWCAICRSESEQLSIVDSDLDLPPRSVLAALRCVGTPGAVRELLRVCIEGDDPALRSFAAEQLAELDASGARATLIERARALPRGQRARYEQALAAYRDGERLPERLPARLRLGVTRELARRRLRRDSGHIVYLAIGAALGSLPLFSLVPNQSAGVRFEAIGVGLALGIGVGEALAPRRRRSGLLLSSVAGGMLAGIVAGIAGIWIVPSPSYTAAIEACQGIATKADLQVATLVAWSLLGAFLALIPALAMTLASWGKRTCSRRTIGLVVGGLVVGALAVLILLLSSSPAASAGQDPLRACLGALRRPVDFSPGPVAYAALDMALIGLAIGLADYLYEHGRARPA